MDNIDLDPHQQLPSKEWYDSATIRRNLTSFATAVVPLIIMAMAAFGKPADADTEEMIASFFLQLISMAFLLGGIHGRLKAKTEIKPVANPLNRQGGFATFNFAVTLFTGAIIFSLILFGVHAHAAVKEATITLEAPTKRADGTPLPASEIRHYQVDFKGPDGTVHKVITKDLVSKWQPPVVGEYTVQAYTVDTEGRMSGPTSVVKYTAVELPPPPVAPPMPPAIQVDLSLPIEGLTPPAITVEGLRLPAQSFLDLTPGEDGTGWLSETVDDREVVKASPGPANTRDATNNARADYLVQSDGGLHTVSFLAYAPDGMSDSLWLGLNGAPVPAINQGLPIFFPTFGKWVQSTPIPVELPAGQTTLSIFKREPGLMISDIEVKKVVQP